jgi:hypothetical protein
VSLSWRDRYTAVLCPERVALVRRAAWRSEWTLLAQAPCAAPTPQAAAQALQDLLAHHEAARGDLTVLLSNHFAQYLLVPWRAQVGSPAEQAAFAGICFDETFGNESGTRELRTAPERAPGARIAAALDTSLLAALRTAAAGSRLRLVSVQPYLCAAFDRLRGALGARDFLFVLAEPTRCCLLLARGGAWRSLRNAAASARPRELANLVEREAQLAGVAEEGMPPVFVHVAGEPGLQLPDCHGVRPRSLPLPGGAPAQDALLAMAMAVA